MEVFFHNNAYYDIENILNKNWNRVLKKRTLSKLFEVCQLWWRRIDEAIIHLSKSSTHTHTGGGVHIYEISDEIGEIEYYQLIEHGVVVAIVIESFHLNLPWRAGEIPQILTANNAMIEVSNIKMRKMRMYENNITESKRNNTMNRTRKRIRLSESKLHRIIKEAINELAPQTYASYADKIRKAGPKHGTGKERMQKAHDAELKAIKAWNDKYGYDHFNDNGLNKQEMLTIPSDRQDFRIKNRNSSFDSNGNHRYHNYDYFPKTMTQNYLRMYSPTDMYKDVTQTSKTDLPWEPFGELDDEYLAAIQMAHPDPENDYVKGKGWKRIADLDESIHRAICRVLR